ncbi:chase2 sensor protein [Leptolyngbya sp. Heron Island J]|uniref:CHASE2 domain-containing protein n=1 Tax=Leptolyngbya sp. Heron Island J TaxID=1385935 RepID=UPI0003B9BD88|nr:CHASE2 domain-containing protein [Leptolyngbya sp. Heron Island J]ESA35285.1 chase2 sensor protein [Leptolyngbya sp. Heron Island J]
MNPLVVLNLGPGNCQQGLANVDAQLWLEDNQIPVKYRGSLPPAAHLPELYQQWKVRYEALNNPFGYRASLTDDIEFDPEPVTNVSSAEFRGLCGQLKTEIDDWLNSAGFRNIDQQLRTKLNAGENIRVIIETEDPFLQKLPWHLWRFFEHYPKAEMALSLQEYERVPASLARKNRPMRILVVLGHSDGINIQPDRLMFENADAETFVLKEPKRSELNECLWDENGWDILFFAGHSTSQALDPTGKPTGQIFLNPEEQLSVEQLRNALKASISYGLKLAIFNSCDGMELARSLADLNLPQMIVMREPVIDPVAHTFLQNFLRLFSQGEAFYTAVRQAREQLQGLEGEYPGATWLPVIFQNPTQTPLIWPVQPSRRFVRQSIKPLQPPEPVSIRPTNSINGRKLAIASLAMTVSVALIRAVGLLQSLELSAYDHLMRARSAGFRQPIDSRLLVVEIREDDTDKYGYPITDEKLATAIEELQQFQPRVIGVDMHRYQVNEPGREDLLAQFDQFPNLVTVCSFGQKDREIMGHPPELSSAQGRVQVGFSDLEIDDIYQRGHSVVRRQLLSYDPRLGPVSPVCSTPYSLSLNLALRYLQAEGVQPLEVNESQNWQLGPVVLERLAQRTVGYQRLDGQSSQILLNYRLNPRPARRISLTDLLAGTIDEDLIRDRVVLIGMTDPVGHDYRQTPYGELPGVWVHGHSVSQILAAVLDERPLIWALPQWGQWQWGDMLWIWGWAIIGGVLVWRASSILILSGAGVVVILGLRQACLLLLVQGGWVPLVPALLALGSTAGVLLAYKHGYLRAITEPLLNKSIK